MYKSISSLILGAGSGKVVGLALLPVLARLYTPDEFGILASFNSLLSVLGPLVTFRYVVAIPLPKNKAVSLNVFAACIISVIFSSLSIALFLGIFSEEIFRNLDDESSLIFSALLVVAVALFGFYEILSFYAVREKKFNIIAISQLSQSAVGGALKIALYTLPIAGGGLVIGHALQQGGGIAGMALAFRSDLAKIAKVFDIRLVFFLLRYFANFPIYKLPAQILMALSSQAPILICNYHYGLAETGQLAFAITIISAPVTLLSQSIAKVYYSEISGLGLRKMDMVYDLSVKMARYMMILGGGASILGYALMQKIFSLIFGLEWSTSGEVASILSIYLVLQFVASPLIMSLDMLGRQKISLIFHATRLAFVLIIFGIGPQLGFGFINVVEIYSAFMLVHYGIISLVVFKEIGSARKRYRNRTHSG